MSYRLGPLARAFLLGGDVAIVFTLALWFYGRVRSFPLLSDDGAANYVSMIHGALGGGFWDLSFRIKWFEGMGQPNLFYSSLFDPFNWTLYFFEPADSLRISYALRAAVGWLLTYALVAHVLPSDRLMATTAATLNIVMCFLLGTPGGVPAWAGIHHMTQVTLFPGLILAYLWMVESSRWFGFREALFSLFLLLFLANYPLNSLIGLAVLLGFSMSAMLVAPRQLRRNAQKGFAKLVSVALVLLLVPGIGLFGDWSAVTKGAARLVFNHELQMMLIPGYEWPNFWRYGMPELQVIVVIALGVLMYTATLGWYERSLVFSLVLGVAGIQIVTLVYASGVAESFFRRLPALSRIELYFTPLYAFCAALVLHRLWAVAFATKGKLLRWAIGAGAAVAAVRAVAGLATAGWILVVAFVAGVIRWAALVLLSRPKIRERVETVRPWVDILAAPVGLTIAILVVIIYIVQPAYVRWVSNPNAVHAPFGLEAICKIRGRVLCEDVPGPSVNAADIPVTRFLRDRLSMEGLFKGRAEFLVGADPADTADPRGRNFRDMVRTSSSNWEAVRNGMVLLAFPFQGIPIASSYEQVLDYKYYLLWSRYINRGGVSAPTANFTTLNHVYLDALGLAGVRYIVARDDGKTILPQMPAVFTWREFKVFELPNVNTGTYAPTTVMFAESLADEIRLMRAISFDPKVSAVVASTDRALFAGQVLAPVEASSIILEKQTLLLKAKSRGSISFLVLPFRHSHCWQATWEGVPGTLVRTDVGLMGVLFQDNAAVKLRWTAGYLGGRTCLEKDNALIPQAIAAAEAIPF